MNLRQIAFALIGTLAGLALAVGHQDVTKNFANLKAIGTALDLYVSDYDYVYPIERSSMGYETWLIGDLLAPYCKTGDIFAAVGAEHGVLNNSFSLGVPGKWGGYGYNYQYLGNSRLKWAATKASLAKPSECVAFAETGGVVQKGGVRFGTYVIDPPMTSGRGSGVASGFFATGSGCGEGADGCRSKPTTRFEGGTTVLFLDLHVDQLPATKLDDKDLDGKVDNGWFNGSGDPFKR